MLRLCLFFGFLWGPTLLVAGEPTFIYLVRHAEKVDESRDPDLALEGQKRAQELAAFFEMLSVDAVFSTEYKRTRQTIEPTAKARGLQVQVHAARDSEGFAAKLTAMEGKIVLAAGHSNTVPAIIKALGGPTLNIDHADYDNLYLVVLVGGKTHLQHLRFYPQRK